MKNEAKEWVEQKCQARDEIIHLEVFSLSTCKSTSTVVWTKFTDIRWTFPVIASSRAPWNMVLALLKSNTLIHSSYSLTWPPASKFGSGTHASRHVPHSLSNVVWSTSDCDYKACNPCTFAGVIRAVYSAFENVSPQGPGCWTKMHCTVKSASAGPNSPKTLPCSLISNPCHPLTISCYCQKSRQNEMIWFKSFSIA